MDSDLLLPERDFVSLVLESSRFDGNLLLSESDSEKHPDFS